MKKLDEFEQAIREGEFINSMAAARDALKPIADGEIERGHCLSGNAAAYGGVPGKRKTTLKDARSIATHVIKMIDRAIGEFDKGNSK